MPRQARLDAPGTLHHVIIRGIEKRRIVDDDEDRRVFIGRLGDIALETDTKILVWSFSYYGEGKTGLAGHRDRAWFFWEEEKGSDLEV